MKTGSCLVSVDGNTLNTSFDGDGSQEKSIGAFFSS